jgi:UDP-N-acetyl-D-galactosamine dehydrogenase
MPLQQIAVVGLGYVGLPLAVALARHFAVVGFDIKKERIAELAAGNDRTGEVSSAELKETGLKLTNNINHLAKSNVFIITVPTPVDAANQPDLTAVRAACRAIGAVLSKGAIVVLESTVYPGVTEEICGPELERASGLRCGEDFFVGYSPERINPGDREHTVNKIVKVVSGQTPGVARQLADMYGRVNGDKVFIARDIKTAEAAKVIENAQRDINIAFINEVTRIFHRVGLSIYDVLDASRTKWNFLPFTPGLVGGHCIGVDPFYLSDLAQRVGHNPEVILAGRRINDAMGDYIASYISAQLGPMTPRPRALVLGLAFKENVPDLRNSKVIDVIRGLTQRGVDVDVHDPQVDEREANEEYGLDLLGSLPTDSNYNVVVGAVAHREYTRLTSTEITRLVKPDGLVADIKGMWRSLELPAAIRRWRF